MNWDFKGTLKLLIVSFNKVGKNNFTICPEHHDNDKIYFILRCGSNIWTQADSLLFFP